MTSAYLEVNRVLMKDTETEITYVETFFELMPIMV